MADSRLVGGKEIPLTPQEQADRDAEVAAADAQKIIDADPDVIAERAIVEEFESSKVRKLLFEINFDQEERLRVIETKPTITRAQYRNQLLVKLKTL